MKKIALAFPLVVAAAFAVTGCAKGTDDTANVTVTNESVTEDGTANLNDAPGDLNAADAKLSDTPANAR